MKVQRSPICYNTGRNYFKGKMLVIYELKTKSTGEGRLRNYGLSYPCHNSNVRHFYPNNRKRQFNVKHDSLNMEAAP